MPGFDPEFVDFPDYIIRITDRIWHQRQVERCLDYYSADCLIHTLAGDISSAQTVVENTYATMASFPDRRLEADNVIWSQDDPETFYSSHLITSLMTNHGPSEFGPATGKGVRVLTVADCVCRENRIIEEWLVRDNAGLALQLGFDPVVIAEQQAESGSALIPFHAQAHEEVLAEQTASVPFPKSPETETECFVKAVFAQLWNAREYAIAKDIYDFRVNAHYPGHRNLYGTAQVIEAISGLLASFPDAKLRVEHVADVPYLGDARDIAVRWTLAGTHSGKGVYGEPGGAPILIIGVSQWRVINGQIHTEWTVWDDIAVHRQIAEARRA